MAHPTYILWVITLVVNGISKVSPLITGVISHLLSGDQWEFQDPKMEVLYHIRQYFGSISPYIAH